MPNHKATAADAARARAAYRAQMLERREKVEALYVQGYTISQIARTLNKDFKTIKNDVTAIETQWQVERAPSIGQAIARSIQTQREVMRQAWLMFHTAADKSTNKAAALNTIIQADKEIRELEGVSAPERLNAAALADILDALTDTLLEVGGASAHQLFLQRLRARSNGIGGSGMNALPQLAAVIGAGHQAAVAQAEADAALQRAEAEALTVDADADEAGELQ